MTGSINVRLGSFYTANSHEFFSIPFPSGVEPKDVTFRSNNYFVDILSQSSKTLTYNDVIGNGNIQAPSNKTLFCYFFSQASSGIVSSADIRASDTIDTADGINLSNMRSIGTTSYTYSHIPIFISSNKYLTITNNDTSDDLRINNIITIEY